MRPTLLSLLAVLLLCSCRSEVPQRVEAEATETAPPWVATLKGDYNLWQDGEAGLGRICNVALGDGRTIGGYAVQTDERCEEQLQLAGEPAAWFVRDDDGALILIDATRKVLLTMQRLEDGSWKDRRNGDYVDAVLLTPPTP